jgi:hypothetical protein
MRLMKLSVIVIVSLTMMGCSVLKEQSGPIVQKAEACGAGPLTGTSTEGGVQQKIDAAKRLESEVIR